MALLLAALFGTTTFGVAAKAAEHASRLPYTSASARTLDAPSAMSRRAEEAAYRPLSFAVVANLPPSPEQAPRAQAFLQWIGTEGKVAFVLDLGNFKTVAEPCSDALYAARYALLNSAPVPLIYVPGQNDWANCAQSSNAATDPIERLDALRDVFLSGPMSLGTAPLRLIRQSELPAFRPYRENTRWIQAGIVFASLNVPGDNNHFYDGGGRNGEYEDREVANRTWIARAVTDARRRHARGLVFFFEGNPHFPREPRSGFSRWLTGLSGRREPDGFAGLRRDLVAASHAFDGPVLVIYADHPARTARAPRVSRLGSAPAADSVVIESILHESTGETVHRLKRIEVGIPLHVDRWLRVEMPASRSNAASIGSAGVTHDASSARVDALSDNPTFRFAMEKVPADLPVPSPAGGKATTAKAAAGQATGTHAASTSDVDDAQRQGTASAASTSGTGSDGPAGEPAGSTEGGDPNSSALGNITTPVLLPLPPLGSTPPPTTAAPSRTASETRSGVHSDTPTQAEPTSDAASSDR